MLDINPFTEFKKLMSARFLFTFAVAVQAVVLGWRMYSLTHDPLFLGLVGLAEAVPAIGLALYAGYIIDRSAPLIVYRRVIFVSFLSGLILLISQGATLGLSDQMQIAALFVSSFLTGTARAFSQPAMFSAVPRMMSRDQLSIASAWMTSAMQIARISGPALGGLIFGYLGTQAAGVVVCISLLAAVASMSLIKIKLPALPPSKLHKSMKDELLSGAKYVFSHPILLPALSLDMIAVFFGGVTALLPIYSAEILHTGEQGLGLLRAAPAVGAAITSLWLTQRDIKTNAGNWLFVAVTGFGISTLAFALSRDFLFSLVALSLSGAFDSVSMVVRGSAVQLSSPASMRGKISAVNSIFIGSSNEIGEFESGVAAKLLGTVGAAVFGAVVCLASVGVIGYYAPRLRKMDLNTLTPDTFE